MTICLIVLLRILHFDISTFHLKLPIITLIDRRNLLLFFHGRLAIGFLLLLGSLFLLFTSCSFFLSLSDLLQQSRLLLDTSFPQRLSQSPRKVEQLHTLRLASGCSRFSASDTTSWQNKYTCSANCAHSHMIPPETLS
eukprot:jgi/Phyca11/564884/estExt2_Genewise1.C_PHYCAscaffold_160399